MNAQQSWLFSLPGLIVSLPGMIVQWLKLGVLDMAGDWRRSADRALEDMQKASQDVGLMEWFWLAVLVLMALGSWYWMLLTAGQQQGLW